MKKGLNDWTEVSGLDGKAIFDNLPEGNYVIEEIKTPGGYSSDGRAYKVTVDKEANITFKDEISGVSHIYVNQEGYFGGGLSEKVTLSSMITGVNTTRKRFEVIYYLKATEADGTGLSLGAFNGMAFTARPYLDQKVGQITDDQLGSGNSSGTVIDGFETYTINDGATDYMPTNSRPDFNDTSKYTKVAAGKYIANSSLSFAGIGSPKGVIIRMVGAYDDTKGKPIFTQGSLAWGGYYCYSSAGVRLNKKEQDQTKQSELEFNVTNTRNKKTPLDKKGVIKLSKVKAGTNDLLGDAEFGLYVGKWDQIGERDEPFAKAKTSATQIGEDTLHDGKLVNLKFQDIPPGTYTLKELKAPDGYEKTLYTWTVRVFPSGLTLTSLNPTFEEDPTLEKPVNVNDKITVSDFNIKVDSTRPRTTIYPNINEFFEMTFKTKMDRGIRRGNYFTIDLDEKLSLEGTLAQVDLPDMTLNGYVLATGEKIPGTNTVKYTFTEAVETIGDLTADFTIALSPNRAKVLNDTKTTFTVNVAGKPFTTTDTFGIDYSGAYPNQFGGNFWWPDYNNKTSLNTAFINKIDNDKAELQNIFYSRPYNTQVSARQLQFDRNYDADSSYHEESGVLGPNSKTQYELYVVKAPNFVPNPAISGADAYNGDMSEAMPRSFAVSLDDESKYTLISSGSMPENGVLNVPAAYVNSHLILKTVSPYDLKKEVAYIAVMNTGYVNGYGYTQRIASHIVTKPSKIFSQSDLTEGEVLAFNKTKEPMKFTLWKKNMDKEVIKAGTVHFKMEVAEDYPDSTPVPDKWKDIQLDLSKQTDAGDPTKSVPLEIEIPAGMTGEYNLIETRAPKGYVINGMRYRIKVDSSARTVQLISVKDSAGNPVEYKFKLPGAATETSLTATNPAPLYREQRDADGKITVDKQLVSIDVLDPQGEYPHAGGLGMLLLYALGLALMAYAARAVYKRKKAAATEKGGAD